MPELPEVQTVVDSIKLDVSECQIISCNLFWKKIIYNQKQNQFIKNAGILLYKNVCILVWIYIYWKKRMLQTEKNNIFLSSWYNAVYDFMMVDSVRDDGVPLDSIPLFHFFANIMLKIYPDNTIFKTGDFVTFKPGSSHFSSSKKGCSLLVFTRGINKIVK